MTEYIITADETKADFDGNVPISAKREVVRCRDCKHYENNNVYGSLCFRFTRVLPDVEGFCAWGERADNGNS